MGSVVYEEILCCVQTTGDKVAGHKSFSMDARHKSNFFQCSSAAVFVIVSPFPVPFSHPTAPVSFPCAI